MSTPLRERKWEEFDLYEKPCEANEQRFSDKTVRDEALSSHGYWYWREKSCQLPNNIFVASFVVPCVALGTFTLNAQLLALDTHNFETEFKHHFTPIVFNEHIVDETVPKYSTNAVNMKDGTRDLPFLLVFQLRIPLNRLCE